MSRNTAKCQYCGMLIRPEDEDRCPVCRATIPRSESVARPPEEHPSFRDTGPEIDRASVRRVVKPFYVASWLGGHLVYWLAVGVHAWTRGTWDPPAAHSPPWVAGLALAGMAYAGIVGAVLVYKMWNAVRSPRTTPHSAAGYLFIPLFNLYWVFRALWRWSQDYNDFVEQRDIEAPRMPENLALAIATITAVGGVAIVPEATGWFHFPPAINHLLILLGISNVLLTTVFVAKACNGINALAGSQVPRADARRIARTGLFLGVLGLLTAGIAAIGGLLLGGLALRTAAEGERPRKGLLLAMATIVLSAVTVVGTPIALHVAVTTLIDKAKTEVATWQAKDLCLEAQMHHDRTKMFPDANRWPEVIEDSFGGSVDDVLASPHFPAAGCGFAMNRYLSSRSYGDFPASKAVLFFEAQFGAPRGGGPELLPDEPRSRQGYIIGFADGHVVPVPESDVYDLVWDPTGGSGRLSGSSAGEDVQGAVELLKNIGPDVEETIRVLRKALRNEGPQGRRLAARVLGAMGSEGQGVVSALIGALGDRQQSVREEAIRAMARIGPAAKDAVPVLIGALSDDSTDVRVLAAHALGCIGPEAAEAVPALEKAREDPEVCTAAYKALSRMKP